MIVESDLTAALLAAAKDIGLEVDSDVTALALLAKQVFTPFSDTGHIDTGLGPDEAVLDFWMDGKAVRAIFQRVPALDKDLITAVVKP